MREMALAARSLRHRLGVFAVTLGSLTLGATLVMTFGSALDTRLATDMDVLSADTLVLVAAVVGGWGLVITTSAVASCLSVVLTRRRREVALLRALGATPAQVTRLVVAECVVLAALAVLLATPIAWAAGAEVLRLLQQSGLVAATVPYAFGPLTLALGLATTLGGAGSAAVLASRRTARRSVRDVLSTARWDDGPVSRWQLLLGAVLVLAGLACAVVTGTVMRDQGALAQSTAGQVFILGSIGLALLSPLVARRVIALVAPVLRPWAGAPWAMAEASLRGRVRSLTAAVVPVVLLTGIAVGGLSMLDLERSLPAPAVTGITPEDVALLETINVIVIAAIVLFAALMLVNVVIAGTNQRSSELARHRLVGATPRQLLTATATEASVLAVLGLGLGVAPSIAATTAYAYARTGTWHLGLSVDVLAGVAVLALVLSAGTAAATTHRCLRRPAVAAARA